MVRTCSLLLVTAMLCLAACDAGEPDESLVAEPGRFSAAVTFDGGDRLAFEGLATASASQLFVLDSALVGDSTITLDSLRTAFMISLGEAGAAGPAGPGRLISFLHMGDQPGPGAYALGGFGRDGFFGFFAASDGSASPVGGTAFVAESGTLTIEVSTDERAAGRFEFRARSFSFGEEGEGRSATIRGAFDADVRDLGGTFPPETPRP